MEQHELELEELRINEVGSYQDACKLLGEDELTLEDFKKLYPKNERKAVRAFGHHQLETMITAVNLNKDGSEYDADYNNYDQEKYWFLWDLRDKEEDAPGSGFALRGVGYGDDYAFLGARLHPRSRKRAQHVAKIGKEAFRMWIRG